MLPNNNAISSIPMPEVFLNPDSLNRAPLVDYEQGGVAVNDVSQGMQVTTWSCYVEPGQSQVYIRPGEGAPIPFVNVSGIEELALSFDQLMRPMVAYMISGQLYLYWYDPIAQQFVTTGFGPGKFPRLSLDDKRAFNVSNSDVIFAYMRNDGLYYRIQRDRYTVEYTVETGIGNLTLVNIGMSRNLRMQFELA